MNFQPPNLNNLRPKQCYFQSILSFGKRSYRVGISGELSQHVFHLTRDIIIDSRILYIGPQCLEVLGDALRHLTCDGRQGTRL